LKNTFKKLEAEIADIETNITVNDDANLKDLWTKKKNVLSSILDEKFKGALIRSCNLHLKDILLIFFSLRA